MSSISCQFSRITYFPFEAIFHRYLFTLFPSYCSHLENLAHAHSHAPDLYSQNPQPRKTILSIYCWEVVSTHLGFVITQKYFGFNMQRNVSSLVKLLYSGQRWMYRCEYMCSSSVIGCAHLRYVCVCVCLYFCTENASSTDTRYGALVQSFE